MYVKSAVSRRQPRSLSRRGMGDIPVYGVNPPFPPAIEQWRSALATAAGIDVPVDFLLAWIDIESGGNPCNMTTETGSQEAGIFQLMSPGNTSVAGTTAAQLWPQPPCSSANSGGGGGQATFAAMTDAQRSEQVRSGLQYVRSCMAYVDAALAASGYSGAPGWTSRDWSYWALVKWVHIAPAYIPSMLQAGMAGAGGIPVDFNDMIQYATTPKPANWVTNATSVGAFGAGGVGLSNLTSSPTNLALLAGGLGLLLAITYRYTHA